MQQDSTRDKHGIQKQNCCDSTAATHERGATVSCSSHRHLSKRRTLWLAVGAAAAAVAAACRNRCACCHGGQLDRATAPAG